MAGSGSGEVIDLTVSESEVSDSNVSVGAQPSATHGYDDDPVMEHCKRRYVLRALVLYLKKRLREKEHQGVTLFFVRILLILD